MVCYVTKIGGLKLSLNRRPGGFRASIKHRKS